MENTESETRVAMSTVPYIQFADAFEVRGSDVQLESVGRSKRQRRRGTRPPAIGARKLSIRSSNTAHTLTFLFSSALSETGTMHLRRSRNVVNSDCVLPDKGQEIKHNVQITRRHPLRSSILVRKFSFAVSGMLLEAQCCEVHGVLGKLRWREWAKLYTSCCCPST